MSISSYPISTDPVIGANDSLYNNNWDQVNIDIQTAIEVEHTDDGEHGETTSTGGPCILETGTYTGNGSDDRTITLTLTYLNILYIEIMTLLQEPLGDGAGYVMRTAHTGDWAKPSNGYVSMANAIQSVGTGSFVIGQHDYTNKLNVDYFYNAYGIAYPLPADAGGAFTPSWVQDGEDINTTIQQRVPAAILSRYRGEHNDDGTHPKSYFKMAIGSYEGTGATAGPSVNPTPLLQITAVIIVPRYGPYYPSYRNNLMDANAGSCYDNIYKENWISTLGGSSFQAKSSHAYINGPGTTYYYVTFGT